ncbi:MAG: DUF1289 domain-containing protein [Stellaceae bacterium]
MTAQESGPARIPESPCIGICLIDPATGHCRGSLRSVAEIASWYSATVKEKRAMLASLAARREGSS